MLSSFAYPSVIAGPSVKLSHHHALPSYYDNAAATLPVGFVNRSIKFLPRLVNGVSV